MEHKQPKNFINPTKELYIAIKEEGLENFIFEVIEECDKEELDDREKYWINYYNSLEMGYNMSTIDNYQRKLTLEQVKAIREDIKNSKLLFKDIANKYKISHSLINQINSGEMWFTWEEDFPLRKTDSVKILNKCPYCGATIGKKSKTCIDCYKILQNKAMNDVGKEKLKELVRNNTLTKSAEILKISIRTLKRWLDKFSIPNTKTDIEKYSDEEWEKI